MGGKQILLWLLFTDSLHRDRCHTDVVTGTIATQICLHLLTITKSDYILKTKNPTKKINCAKEKQQFISNMSCKFGYFWKKLNFWAPKTSILDARGAQTRYDVTWKFTPIFIFNTLRIFYVKMVTSEGGKGARFIEGLAPSYPPPEALPPGPGCFWIESP